MTTELEPYQRVTGELVTALPPATDRDGWIAVVAEVANLAQHICDTEFVPDAMRGKPAAVTAAILAGREMGVGPMTALQHIHVIKGKPGQSAHLMRALVLAAGHEFEYLETTDSRAVVRGRRNGESSWTEVTFTSDQARKAQINLGGYPEDKLIARATARLCRRKFADVISGLAYTVEELQDGDVQFTDDIAAQPAAIEGAPADTGPAQRTAQRRTKRAAAKPAPARPEQPDEPHAGPPLPDEEEQPTSSDQGGKPDTAAEEPEQRPDADEPGSVTPKQLTYLGKLFTDAGVKDREHRLKLCGQILNKPAPDSAKELSRADAGQLIDTLEELHRDGALVDLVASFTTPQAPAGDDARGEEQPPLPGEEANA